MKGVVNLTRWVLSICLLIGAIFRIDIFSIIYALLFLAIPWAFIHSTVARLRFFFILALVSLITSTFFLLMISAVHIYSVTTKGKDLFINECSFTTNRVLFVLSLVIDVIIVCKKICFYFE
jgi:hypothetical protein